MKVISIKLMLLGIMLMVFGGAIEALGLEWVLFIAGLILGIAGFFYKDQKEESK